MTVSAYITRCNATDGSFNRSLTVERSEVDSDAATGVRSAAKWLLDFETGHSCMVGRTLSVHACQIASDPQIVNTGWKAFDEQANRSGGFLCGNVSSNVQFSNHVRSHSTVRCNGTDFQPGQLRASDLFFFNRDQQTEATRFSAVSKKLCEPGLREQDLIVYQVFHTDMVGERKIHGWVVTKVEGELVYVHMNNKVPRSLAVLDQAINAFTLATLPQSTKPLLVVEKGELQFVAPEVRAWPEHLVDAGVESRPALRG